MISGSTPSTKHARLTRLIRNRIIRGELLPGDRLPSFAELRAQHGIALSTIEKVLGTLEKEGLVERQQGRGTFVAQPKSNLTGNLGLIVSRGYESLRVPFYTLNASGLQSAALKHDKRLLLLATDRDWDALSFELVDGLILSGHNHATNSAILKAKPPFMPCVSMFVLAEGMSSVIVDDYRAAKTAVRYLYEKGHRRIACLMQTGQEEQIVLQRLAGYRDVLREAGIDRDPRWERLCAILMKQNEKQSFLDWGREQMKEWLEQSWKEMGCTAILAQNDEVAIGIMQVLQESGISVPADVSVMGFDGTELCDHVMPRLTSMQLPLQNIGAKAIDLLVEQIEKGCVEEQTIMLSAVVRDGDSVASI